MHYVRVPLDGHELFYVNSSVLADAAQIVAAEVHQHDVFGALLFIGEHLFFQTLVFRFVFSAPTGACNRPVENVAPLHFDQHFRRTAHNRDIVHLQKEKIGRGIQRAQLAIDFEWRRLRLCGEALADDYLKDIAGANVFLCFANRSHVSRLGKIRINFQFTSTFRFRVFLRLFFLDGLLQQFARLLDFLDSRVVLKTQSTWTLREDIAHNPQPVLHMIERNQPVVKHEHRVEETYLVAQLFRQTLDQPHHVVAEITDRAGDKRRQSWQANRPEPLHAPAQESDRIFFFPDDAVATFQNTCAVRIAKNFFRVGASKRVTRDFLAAFHAFEQKRMTRTLRNSQIRANGSKQISRKNVVNRDEIALFGELLEFAEGWLNHD